MTDANDGIALAKTSEEDNNKNHKKEITWYKCKKTGHHANKCDKEETVRMSNKKGSNFLVYKNNKYESSSDEENHYHEQGNTHGNLHAITDGNNEEEKHEEDDEESEEESTDEKEDD